ncbi:MAG TPA: GNAT family N-acetyltransferase [Ktedonobacterales bacterium]|nr:GNAT family N-acetyltransferase [Ktedonobacterales bacterium]
MAQTISAITLLADRPELAVGWAELHWREWGDEPGREELSWWVDAASQAIQRTSVPAAFIAHGPAGEVLGGVGLSQFDPDERRDRSPWVVGTIVRADLRGQGIGQALMDRLEAWAIIVGIEQVWVCTEREGRAATFYQQCGYERVENLITQRGEEAGIFTRRFSPARP